MPLVGGFWFLEMCINGLRYDEAWRTFINLIFTNKRGGCELQVYTTSHPPVCLGSIPSGITVQHSVQLREVKWTEFYSLFKYHQTEMHYFYVSLYTIIHNINLIEFQ